VLGGAAAPAWGQGAPPLEGRPVARIDLPGLKWTKEYVVRREFKTRPGEPLSSVLLERDLNRLLNLGIFSKVKADTLPQADSVLVSYELVELPRLVPYPRLSYTVENGWSFGLGVVSPNLTGRAIVLSMSGTIGGANQGNFYFRHPWLPGGDHLALSISASQGLRHDEMNDFDETSTEFSASLDTYIGEVGRGGFTADFLRIESDSANRTLSPDNRDDMFTLSLNGGWDERDKNEDPHRGWQNEFLVSWTGGFTSPAANFWTVQADVRKYLPMPKQQKLLVSVLASVRSGRVGENFPTYLQYYLGGANTIRGYDLFELGPTLHGMNQLLATAEYQWTFWEPHDVKVLGIPFRFGVQAAAFTDWGNAWSIADEFSTERRKVSAGVGLRLLAPGMNMVRFDVGFGEDGEINFAFGAGTKMDAQKKRVR
jgi:outer membrane protein insertion porin family